MWEYEYSVETTATAEAVWRHWSDVAAWPQWNEGIESITINGPFAVGTGFTMTPPGDEPVSMRLTHHRPTAAPASSTGPRSPARPPTR